MISRQMLRRCRDARSYTYSAAQDWNCDVAVLMGSIDRGAGAAFDDEVRRLDDARDWAMTALGDDRYRGLYAEGAARDIPAAGAWALAALRTPGT